MQARITVLEHDTWSDRALQTCEDLSYHLERFWSYRAEMISDRRTEKQTGRCTDRRAKKNNVTPP